MTLVASAQRHRRALGVVLAVYLLGVALVLGWPTPVDAPINGALYQVLDWLHVRGMPGWIGYGEVEFAANIALFVPVGLLLTLELGRRRWWLAVLAGFGVSLLAELAQGSLRPERFATMRDLVANTAGTVIGALTAVVAARRPSPSAQDLDAAADSGGVRRPGVAGDKGQVEQLS